MASIEELTRERYSRPPAPTVAARPVSNAIPGLAVQEMSRMPPEFQQAQPRAQAAAQPPGPRAAPGAAPATPSIAQPPVRTEGRLMRAANAMGGKRAVVGGAALTALPEAVNVGRVALANGTSIGDVATQAAEGTGRTAATLAGAGLGAKGGAALGTMAMPGVGTAIGGALGALGGGIAGYMGADKAIRAGRSALGADPRSPVDKLPAAPARTIADKPAAANAANMPAKPIGAGAGRGFVNPPTVGQGPAPQQPGYTNPAGTIMREGNSYSGKDIKFGADIRTPTGALRNGGTVSSLDTSEGHRQNLMEIARGRERESQQLRAQEAQIAAAMQAGGSYGNFHSMPISAGGGGNDIAGMLRSGEINAQQAKEMVSAQEANQKMPIAQLRANTDLQTVDASNATQRSIADQRAGTDLQTANIGANARTSAAELAAERRAQATESAAASRVQAAEAGARKYTVVPGGQEVVDIGGFPATVTRPSRVIDNATGKAVAMDEQGGQQQGQQKPPEKGAVVKRDGVSYRFKGGDPSKPESWERN